MRDFLISGFELTLASRTLKLLTSGTKLGSSLNSDNLTALAAVFFLFLRALTLTGTDTAMADS